MTFLHPLRHDCLAASAVSILLEVREHLMVQARLKLPSSFTTSMRIARVEENTACKCLRERDAAALFIAARSRSVHPAVPLHPHLVYEDEATPGFVSLDFGSPTATRSRPQDVTEVVHQVAGFRGGVTDVAKGLSGFSRRVTDVAQSTSDLRRHVTEVIHQVAGFRGGVTDVAKGLPYSDDVSPMSRQGPGFTRRVNDVSKARPA
ncbi:unnamed protein product [Heligmosomoides polygyrus]|uniref:Senescence domain-containing protein n=1 Tax=Heligmosomoides polygyrus TaxID=6339 RepID=A0A183GAY8_HELPZ|nr:unnamed protein product [Heligmosomoides polygyrus]